MENIVGKMKKYGRKTKMSETITVVVTEMQGTIRQTKNN